MGSKNEHIETERELEGVQYRVLLDVTEIRDYVERIAKDEWSGDDFKKYGEDLHKSDWRLEEVAVEKIRPNDDLFVTSRFQEDLKPRILKQREIQNKRMAIPPLILRGSDFLIFDGYARWKVLKEKGIKRCLAYVGHLFEVTE